MTNFLHEDVLGDIELNTINENGKRLYVTPDGEKYPSVTTVLSIRNKQGLHEWRKRVGEDVANYVANLRSTQLITIANETSKNAEDLFKFDLII